MKEKELIELAKEALKDAYAPYSNFKVGAVLVTRGGKVFTGSNIENVSSGLSICAERVAALKAVSEGYKDFEKMIVIADSDPVCKPCGSCRQVLYEFNPQVKLILVNFEGKRVETTAQELLPQAFRLKENV